MRGVRKLELSGRGSRKRRPAQGFERRQTPRKSNRVEFFPLKSDGTRHSRAACRTSANSTACVGGGLVPGSATLSAAIPASANRPFFCRSCANSRKISRRLHFRRRSDRSGAAARGAARTRRCQLRACLRNLHARHCRRRLITKTRPIF